jgi:dipeptidyl aminopeptidase/acylaminoacyl peptidase
MIHIETLLRIPCVDAEYGFDISPDGQSIAFSWNKTGRWEIYQVPLDGSTDPVLVSVGEGAKFNPKYSPDGAALAFVADFDGSERYHIFLLDLSTGKQTDLTPDIDDSLRPKFDWSPDGKQIACMADISGCFDTYILDIASREMHPVFANGYAGWEIHWSPDGQHLAVTVEWVGQDYGTFIVPVHGGEAHQVGAFNVITPAWSPDGRRLAFASDVHGRYQIGFYDLTDGCLEWLLNSGGDDFSPAWAADGRLAFVRQQGARQWLAITSPGKEPETYEIEPGLYYYPTFTPDSRSLVFVFDNPRYPNDLWRLDLNTRRFCQLTHSLPADFPQTSLVISEEIYYPAQDGAQVPAVLYKPPQAGPDCPAVIVIHGGPGWLFSIMWYPFMAYLASRGWVVLAPNYRGSTGYGREWQYANRFDLGGVDARDVLAGVDYLVQNGLADPQKIAVSGRSHGGYLTMVCLTQFPNVWAGGSAVVPFLNWFTSHANSRSDLQHWDRQNFGSPEENYDLWYERSPFFFLERIQAPVQLICGENDPLCPPSESIAARDRLLALGKEVDFVLYKGEGHTFLKMENLIDSESRRVAFLERVLARP